MRQLSRSNEKVPLAGYRFGDQKHTFLLTQDDSIPGNRKDSFRFHYLLFIIITSPLYLWLELSFGVRLLDHISRAGSLDSIHAIEHWGRLISGCSVSLLFLAQWFGQCEKWDRPWPLRLLVAIVICLVAMPLTWVAQSRFIDFYVKQGRLEIALAIPLLSVIFFGGLWAIRRWLKTYAQRRKAHPVITIVVLVMLAGGFVALLSNVMGVTAAVVTRVHPATELATRLGAERQQAATLSLIRRGIQIGTYNLIPEQSADLTRSMYESPEGKAALAMFPVLGSAMNQSEFAAARPSVLREVMYRDWDEQYGEQVYVAFKGVEEELRSFFAGPYRLESIQFLKHQRNQGLAYAKSAWARVIAPQLEDVVVRPGLSWDEFRREPGLARVLALRLACFDCRFQIGMERAEFTRALFFGTQLNNVWNVLNIMEDPAHFQAGNDGETAARAYWVPIWALLFSMLGAFTHIFKLTFTLMEYAHLRSFAKIHAADSPLASDVIANARRGLAGVMAGIVLFVFFSENQVTGHPLYAPVHASLWNDAPIIGGIGAHWTINAQGMIYPLTKKLCPSWLSFSDDPFERAPLSAIAGWIADD